VHELIDSLSAATNAARVSRQTGSDGATAIGHGLTHVAQPETQTETTIAEYHLARRAVARVLVELHHAARATAITDGIGAAAALMPRPHREKPSSATLCIAPGEEWAFTRDDCRDVIGETFRARLRATKRQDER